MDSKMINIIIEALGQTIYMVFFSTLFASVLGFILGIIVTVTSPTGLRPNIFIYKSLDVIINCSVTFLIHQLLLVDFTFIFNLKNLSI